MAQTVKIVPVLEDGKLVYPASITNAIVDPKTRKTLDKLIDGYEALASDEYELSTEDIMLICQ